MNASRRRGAFWPLVGCVAMLATVWVPTPTSAQQTHDNGVQIRVLSNRADLISGGDALVEIVLPETARVDDVHVRNHGPDIANRGRDISAVFERRSDGRVLGLVEGLEDGDNVVTARLPDRRGARLTITNHPIGGPVFAGPQVQPWICTTEANGLGPAKDGQCNAPTEYFFYYKSDDPSKTAGCDPEGPWGWLGLVDNVGVEAPRPDQDRTCLRPYNPDNPPSDVARTTTDQGVTVPYIVRVERGVIDRGIYDIAVLYDPTKPWEPWAPQPGWNGKVFWTFGGGWSPKHSQTAESSAVLRRTGSARSADSVLSQGFAIATSGLHTGANNGNSVVSAESVMMQKEHLIETYGPVRYTLSDGSSGGSMMQHLIASTYPGLLDGINPGASFPDVWTTTYEPADCGLLIDYFTETSPHLWPVVEQQARVMGKQDLATCVQFSQPPIEFDSVWYDPTICDVGGAGGGEWVYDPETNPGGTRCTLQDYQEATFGRRAKDGFANRPFDNVGVQYGLVPLQSGLITAEQFVDLNEKIGGPDIDWNWQPQRSEADSAALRAVYRSGQVTNGRELATVPIIDSRESNPPNGNSLFHDTYHTYAMRKRLEQANGSAANQVIQLNGSLEEAFGLLDRWLSKIEADRSDDPLEVKVLRNKPADAVDSCNIATGGFLPKVVVHKMTDPTFCRTAYPYYGDARIAAGGPLAGDIMKCQLKPLERSDYNVTFTDAQWARLQEAFPSGVCNWNVSGVGQRPNVPWLTYANGPDGQPLGEPPTSQPLSPGGPSNPDRPECDTDRPGNQPPHCEDDEHPGRGQGPNGQLSAAARRQPLPATGGGFAVAGLIAAVLASRSLRPRDRRLDHLAG